MTDIAVLPRDPALKAIANFKVADAEHREVMRIVRNLPLGTTDRPPALRTRARCAHREIGRARTQVARAKPKTLRGARELLSVVISRLKERSAPDGGLVIFADDLPVVEVLERVEDALDTMITRYADISD